MCDGYYNSKQLFKTTYTHIKYKAEMRNLSSQNEFDYLD